MGFLTNCKKEKDLIIAIPEPKPGEVITEEYPKFLKTLTVPGSEKIVFDSLNRAYIVTMPAGHKDDAININLSLYDGVKLADNTFASTNDTTIKFAYKGSLPLGITLQKSDQWNSFNVFVQTSGPINIQMSYKDIPLNIGWIHFPFKVISGLGTIPSGPNQKNPTVKLINRNTNSSLEGLLGSDWKEMYFADMEKLLNTSKLTLEINFPGSSPLIFDDISFKRGLPEAFISNNTFLYSRNDTINVHGGYFLPSEKYVVQFSNDHLANPISVEMDFKDMSAILTTLPKAIPAGSYLMSFYENGKIIGKNTGYVSDTAFNYIETIWKGNTYQSFSRNVERLSLNKGDVFYSKLIKPQFAYGSSGVAPSSFDAKLLPDLRLKNSSVTIDLKSELIVVGWAVAGASLSVSKYIIPANLQSGFYEIIPLFAGKEAKPYWSKVEIK